MRCPMVLVVPAIALAVCGCATGGSAARQPTQPPSPAAETVAPTPAASAQSEPVAPGAAATAHDPDVEVVTVTEQRLLDADGRRRIYRELAEGKRLFSQKQIKEALPYLLNAAEHGFKDSQARVGYIYIEGLGDVERDAEQGVGWLGVASTGRTSPAIRNYFNDIWKRIPEHYVPYFEEVVEEYRVKYGEQATGVVCELHRPVRSFVKELGCFFEAGLPEDVRVSLEDYKEGQMTLDMIEARLAEARLIMEDAARSRPRELPTP